MREKRQCGLLLIEDQEEFAHLVAESLHGDSQFVLRTAPRLDSAIAAIARDTPDIILLDLGLPDSGGLDTLRRVSDAAPNVPVVIMTGADDDALERDAVFAGAQDYLKKQDFDRDILVRALRHALDRSTAANLARAREEQLRVLVRQLPLVIWSTDADLRYTSVAGARLGAFFRGSASAGTPMADSLGLEHPFVKNAKRALTGESLTCEMNWEDLTFETYTTPLRDDAGAIVGVLGFTLDITERHEQDLKLRRSEESLANAQRIANMGNWDLNISTGALFWSAQIYEMFGMPASTFEPSYEAFLSRVHPDDRERVNATSERAQKQGTPIDFEHRIVLPDGRVRVVHEVGDLTRDAAGNAWRLTGTVRDVTKEREVAAALRQSVEDLHALSARMDMVREQERGRIAREVHDGLGQALTALKMDVFEVLRRLKHNDLPAAEARLDEMTGLIDDAVDSVRRVSEQLRPVEFSEAGLAPTVQAFLSNLARRAASPRFVMEANMEGRVVDEERARAILRILQECVTNVLRHAKAETVRVSLSTTVNHLRLVVEDDGVGFTPGASAGVGTLGLMGMHDRARLLNGNVVVSSAPGTGCTITAEIPLR